MNIRLGLKRLYVIFSVTVLSIVCFLGVESIPTEEKLSYLHLSSIKVEIADRDGVETWQLPNFSGGNNVSIDRYCGELSKPNVRACTDYKEAVSALPRDQFKHLLATAGIVAIAALALLLLYLTMRWVINGFFPKNS